MEGLNKTPSGTCQFLDDSFVIQLYEAFIAAFADYVLPFDLTEQQFRNHILLNGVDLNSTIGVVKNNKLIAFTLNGFGTWKGRSTVYDAGTGVLPPYRRRGLGLKMFDEVIPYFADRGIEQYLLEVVTTNTNAIRMYEKLGFSPTRKLALLEAAENPKLLLGVGPCELREVEEPDWTLFCSFWDGDPSWQNSIEALARSRNLKRIFAAFLDGNCVGYIVYSVSSPKLAQIAVAREHRRKGIGSQLLKKMIDTAEPTSKPQVINLDYDLTGARLFFEKHGFSERLSQFEMIRSM